MPVFNDFDFRIALARRRGANFVDILGSRSSAPPRFSDLPLRAFEATKLRKKTQHFAQFLPAKISHVSRLRCKTSLLSNIEPARPTGNFQYSRKLELLNFLWLCIKTYSIFYLKVAYIQIHIHIYIYIDIDMYTYLIQNIKGTPVWNSSYFRMFEPFHFDATPTKAVPASLGCESNVGVRCVEASSSKRPGWHWNEVSYISVCVYIHVQSFTNIYCIYIYACATVQSTLLSLSSIIIVIIILNVISVILIFKFTMMHLIGIYIYTYIYIL